MSFLVPLKPAISRVAAVAFMVCFVFNPMVALKIGLVFVALTVGAVAALAWAGAVVRRALDDFRAWG